jgi:DNA-binding transcriptional regulator YhcF (GntR family)
MEDMIKERLPQAVERSPRLSYKFQRLRERLREAIETGVLTGKLPGERVLARQFRVNAKTLSKALTDLAAEGLLERTIGRGTYVRGSVEAVESKSVGKWIVICQSDRPDDTLIPSLRLLNEDVSVISDVAFLRPSSLAGVTAAIDLHGLLDDSSLRDLMLRSIRVVLVDRQPQTLSTHAVLIDRTFCGTRLTQSLLREGHRHIGVIDREEPGELLDAVRQAAHRFDPAIRVRSLTPEALTQALSDGLDAVVCADYDSARAARAVLASAGIDVPGRVSVLAMGLDSGRSPAVSGMAVSPGQLSETIHLLLSDGQSHRPQAIWVIGAMTDHHTSAPRKA